MNAGRLAFPSPTSRLPSLPLFVVAGIFLLVFVLLGTLPVDDTAALLVAIGCMAVGLCGLSFIANERERLILTRLFCLAFALRLGFAFLGYKTDFIKALSGGDEVIWRFSWSNAQDWHHRGPDGLPYFLKKLTASYGYYYFASWFYYLLDVRSQMALAFLNCFLSALTVLVIYKFARDFFSERASLFAAMSAALLPGFYAWAALTIKESWLIFFEITAFFAICRCARKASLGYGLLATVMVVLTLSLRAYAGYALVVGATVSFLCYRSKKPLQTMLIAVPALAGVLAILVSAHLVNINPLHTAETILKEMVAFRNSSAGGFRRAGSNTSIVLDYDLTTPKGAAMMLIVGSAYLYLAPFPWQMFTGRNAFTAPDVLLWYFLFFGFILRGVVYAWKRQQVALLSIVAFVMPLGFFYSMIFSNVGLAYRQRAQLMPFLLILAAAGYDAHLEKMQPAIVKLVALLKRTFKKS